MMSARGVTPHTRPASATMQRRDTSAATAAIVKATNARALEIMLRKTNVDRVSVSAAAAT